MKIGIWLIVSLAILYLAVLSGCGSVNAQTEETASPTVSSIETSTPPVTFNLSAAQGIWVNGQGVVMATPDIAKLSLGVSVQAGKVADAQSQAAAVMAKVMAALTDNGVAQKDISTQYYSIDQLTRYDNDTQQNIITGYRVTNMVDVIIRSIDKVGTIIDAVSVAGGDATRINGISFDVDNTFAYNSQARTLAIEDAKTKAQQLADLAGVTLGRPVYIIENPTFPPITYLEAVPVAASATPTTPISPGEIKITINVQVAYAIQ